MPLADEAPVVVVASVAATVGVIALVADSVDVVAVVAATVGVVAVVDSTVAVTALAADSVDVLTAAASVGVAATVAAAVGVAALPLLEFPPQAAKNRLSRTSTVTHKLILRIDVSPFRVTKTISKNSHQWVYVVDEMALAF